MNFPAELKYSRDHEWVKMLDDTTALVGITDFAQSELGDLVYHAMVLMVEMGISLEDVVRELARRHVIDKKVKQERMQ